MITLITEKHLQLFLDLKKNNPGQWKLGAVFNEAIDDETFFKRLISENFFTLGYVVDNKLLSITTLYEFSQTASWSWFYYCQVKSNYANFNKTQGLNLVNQMFLEGIKRKLTSCLILVRNDWPLITSDAVGSMKKQIKKYHDQVPEIKKYHWADEAIIPANSEPKYEYQKFLCGYKSWPIDLRLRLGVLKQEFRDEILKA